MPDDKEIPWIHLDLLTARITGAELITTTEQAEELALATGTQVQRDTAHSQEKHRTFLDEPFTELEVENDGTDITVHIYDDGSLEEELQWVVQLIRNAVRISGAEDNAHQLRIRLCMNADKIPDGEPEERDTPLSNTYQTEAGTAFQHMITWEKDDDISEDMGETSYNYWADSITGHIPDEEEMENLLKATYSVAAAAILGDMLADPA